MTELSDVFVSFLMQSNEKMLYAFLVWILEVSLIYIIAYTLRNDINFTAVLNKNNEKHFNQKSITFAYDLGACFYRFQSRKNKKVLSVTVCYSMNRYRFSWMKYQGKYLYIWMQ